MCIWVHNRSYSAATWFGVLHRTSLINFNFTGVLSGTWRRPNAILYLGSHRQESLFNIRCVFSWSLQKWNTQLTCVFLIRSKKNKKFYLFTWNICKWKMILTAAVFVSTTFLVVKSHLLPTSNLFTFSQAYRSISSNHCFTLLNDSWSVQSYTTIIPCAPR